ncbi:hypothetical protein LEP1GSC125_3242 [Leptospira mayottensis 200901122]|uniref:Uncharacterized protein n=1 Tax=Leptospira mayottensis 200901122 TaxID=1193010 RepID=A0AA87MNP5_9LEPT|nr:hypothetical protein LEP1GSC125_3242 [Leptospira mayottensis 200901122]
MFYSEKVIDSLKKISSSLKDPRRIMGVLFLKIHFTTDL